MNNPGRLLAIPNSGILSGTEIIRQVREGNIIVDPFDESMVGPNSLDVRLGPELIELVPSTKCWDLTQPISDYGIIHHMIPKEGFILRKGVCYLGHTIERTWCRNYVPWLDTRSTVGRYFLQCHMTAGRGDCQWEGTWTMEMVSMGNDLRVYAGLPVAQVSFFSMQGPLRAYEGKYNGQTGPKLPNPLKLASLARGHDHVG